MALQFDSLYNFAARWANDETSDGVSRAKDAVDEANRLLSYGSGLPLLKPWWRKRESTITPVAGTQSYALPSGAGTVESLHEVWYRTNGSRLFIDIADDQQWAEEANEDTGSTGTPDICNLFSDAGTAKLRFSPTPSGSFVSSATSIRLDFFIEETLTASSVDSVEPLMPDSRRYGIGWKAVEVLAARQGDRQLLEYAALKGKRYYELILADDITRTGKHARKIRPSDPVGLTSGRLRTDYGRTLR